MNILLFGATGSIGVHTALHLKEKGHNIIALGHRQSDNGFFQEHGITYHSVDIVDPASFEAIKEPFETVIHFAGAMPARMCGYNPYEYINSIILGTLNILEFMRGKGAKKIVFSQSIADVLYKFGTTVPISDDSERKFPLNTDHSIYSISKNTAVSLIEHYSAKYGFKSFILRLPTIYVYHPNPFYYVDGEKKWMGYRFIINQASQGHTLEIWGNPHAVKEMVYIKDFIQIVNCCVDSNLSGGIYNVGCGQPISIENQIQIIARVFNLSTPSKIVYKPEKPSSPQFVLDISKSINELGYKPQYDFESMMIDFKEEMKEEPFSKLWGKKEDYI